MLKYTLYLSFNNSNCTDRQMLVDGDQLQHTDHYSSHESQYYRTKIQATKKIAREYESEPGEYMCLAILTCFCCLPLGICAVFATIKANDDRAQGHFEEARKKNSLALVMMIASAVFGIAATIVFTFVVVIICDINLCQ
ncbi:trafficking regulator of GLUT4 1-like [Mytilus californianus]|uniref:trafficking regulator of GLUT4 1-like n=1 Tax=Mytilus californianus TaxID=6549 RepID=UPI0022482074|nr:trafficking regulator of GLUT4 1-like [Mytilus californianus]